MRFIKRGKKYLCIMDDDTEYEVHDNKLTKEEKDRIRFHHEHVAPLTDKIQGLQDTLDDVVDALNDIKEKLGP